MKNAVMDVDELNGIYLEVLKNIKADGLEEFDLDKILFNQVYYSLTRGSHFLRGSIICAFFFKREKIHMQNRESELLLFSEQYKRKDHFEYWKNICDIFDKKDILSIESLKNSKNIFKYFDLTHIFRKVKYFTLYCNDLQGIDNRLHRWFLATQLVWLHEFLYAIDQLALSPKVAMCFFDSGFHESLLVQYLRNRGVATVTNQHGQPVYRDKKHDRMNQSQILNFQSDYYIAKGEFTKDQFVKAGFSSDNIVVLGGFSHNIGEKAPDTKTNYFGLFLDCPFLPFAKQSNSNLIQMANQISEQTGMKYYLKVHPTDDEQKYAELLKDYGRIYSKSNSLESLFEMIEYGIFYASAIYIDLLNGNKKAYQYQASMSYPIVCCEEDKFTNCADFLEKYHAWTEKPREEKERYLQNIREQYCISTGFEKRLKLFVDNLVQTT